MAILATFTDLKPIKGRKVVQVVLEVPMEKADEVLAALGGYPQSDNPQWVGVAPIDPEAAEKPKGGNLAQRAGIMCGEGAFVKYMQERHRYAGPIDPESIAGWVRSICNVESRAELDHNPDAAMTFEALQGKYRAWRMCLD